ncbi:MAG: triose-phosphate isomerase [Planctomycetota bacterium]|nr:MAG: triose-phosphate isomerase [Planctomycetota bacterium]RLS97940.1 MAG: triose-phosphate isomerase [Planctomycetota bacterium]
MRRLFIAGNWKMNLNRGQSLSLVQSLVESLRGVSDVDIAVCPPAVYLGELGKALHATNIGLGAQNVNSKAEGAYTGEISCSMLKDVGCRYVILGHSERRAIYGETDSMVNEKLHAVLAAGLTPIVCVGETLEQREAGQTQQVVRSQCIGSLAGLTEDQMLKTVLAYEPVWAIGTGKTASPAQAEEVHKDIRSLLETQFSVGTAQKVIVLYGGSVKADNAQELLSEPNIDGALVGGASLKQDSFEGIIKAATSVRK